MQPVSIKSIGSFFVSHWFGNVPLRLSISLALVAVSVATILLQRASQGGPEALIIGAAVVSFPVAFTWQLVGYVRTCRSHLEEGGDQLLVWAGHLVLVSVLVAGASETIGSILSLERFRSAPEAAAAPRTNVLRVGSSIRIDGEIDYATHAALIAMLEADEAVSTIELNSNGGLVYAARAIAKAVSERSMDTLVRHSCSSACTLIFAAGKQRRMIEDGRLGFHSYGRPTSFHQLLVDPEDEFARDLRYLRQRGMSEAFLARAAGVGNDTMWFPQREELLEGGVITSTE